MISGRALRWSRVKRGWTQQELAEKMGVTRNTILAWENEKTAISEENVKKVRELFGRVDAFRKDFCAEINRFVAYNAQGAIDFSKQV